MAQHSFCNAFKLIKAKQKEWKQSLRKKITWLKTKDNSKLVQVRDLDTTAPQSYPTLRRIRPARRRFPIDDSFDSDFDSEEDIPTESSSSPLDGSSSSSKVWDVPPSSQNSCSTTSAFLVFPTSSSPETETETDVSNGSYEPETPSTTSAGQSGDTLPIRPNSFSSSTCTSSARDSYVTAVSYWESEDENDPDGDASIVDTRSDTPSYTSIFQSQESESGTSTTSVSSISY